ncbi:MAG: hypothetical protein LBK47_01615 [Prevotellaceae bacterium]|jgi:hypothetical protein|nr:hypothetical protein [Prevotellaceae bacterium]
MKNKILHFFTGAWRPSMTVTLALSLALAVSFSACSKDDDNGGGNLYRPSQDMSSEEILTLFDEVTANMATVRQVSVDEIFAETYQGKTPELYKDSNFTQKVNSNSSLSLTNNNTVLYAKWVSKSAAKSLFKKVQAKFLRERAQ